MSSVKTKEKLGPIELEVIHGTIRAAELEIEAAVERTARSPMIRDQHDYRVALFDAKGRKLTGRSYSAIVEPVFEYFGSENVFPGDIFFWNDPYNSCGGIGHVPDLCTTVPIFWEDRLIGFSQVFGHHDDVSPVVWHDVIGIFFSRILPLRTKEAILYRLSMVRYNKKVAGAHKRGKLE